METLKRPAKDVEKEENCYNVHDMLVDGVECNTDAEKDVDTPLLETDMGIIEYISKNSAIPGVFKQRISDFIVNEVSADGKVVHLTSCLCPAVTTACDTESNNILTEEWTIKLTDLMNKQGSCNEVFLEIANDKTIRTQVHEAIRKSFPCLESSTVDKNGPKIIKVTKINSNVNKRREVWPKNTPDFCQFVLYKENTDTMEAVGVLARQLKLRVSVFSYAGTKDRRGKTTQLVTAYRVTAERLASANKQLRNIKVGNFTYCDKPLRLGELKGNRFQVVLRSISDTNNELYFALKSMQDNGFLNYFGTQRFGTTSIPTHHVGRELLKSNWKAAIDLILKPRGSVVADNDRVERARRVWSDTHDADAALSELGYRQCVEHHLLIGIKKSARNDYLGALGAIPRNSRLMYVHSFQSYVWNRIVSQRVRQFGLQLMPGDLVLRESDAACDTVDDNDEIKPEVVDTDKSMDRPTPIVLTADTIPQYSIYDWVLPTPGHAVTFPDNVTAQWYADIMSENGLDLKCFNNSSQRDMWLPGAYRHVVVRPDDLNWEVVSYSDPLEDLALSDWDIMEQRSLPCERQGGDYRALKMSFSLPSSSYANMAVREVLKVDTTPGHQSSLNVRRVPDRQSN